MHFTSDDYEYGPVFVSKGPNRGRIGEFDDTAFKASRTYGCVYFAGFGITPEYSLVPISYLRPPNTRDLLSRHEDLWRSLTPYSGSPLQGEPRIIALQELAYISNLLNERMFEAQYMQKHSGAKIFLSHASVDKAFVKGLAVDLTALGHRPWLDEWEILGGESIPTRIAAGLEESDYVIVVLSKSSVESRWVETEWQSKHWHEVSSQQISVIPVLLNDCQIPTLLRMKKYIDFRQDYSLALEQLANTLNGHTARRHAGDA